MNNEEQIILTIAKLKTPKKIKQHLFNNLREDIKNSIWLEVLQEFKRESQQLQGMIAELMNTLSELGGTRDTDTNKINEEEIVQNVKNMFEIYIKFAPKLYLEDVRRQILEELKNV